MNDKNLEQKLIEQHVEDLAGKRALAEPFPGALKDAFALAPEIEVGPFKIRRFRDGDFKLLAKINSPLNDFLRACLLGDSTGGGARLEPTGQDMWNLALVFTKPARYSKELIESKGVAAFAAEAEETFSELRLAALAQILKAIVQQANIYATANIEYGEIEQKGENGESRPNPPSSAVQLTDSAGSLTKSAG